MQTLLSRRNVPCINLYFLVCYQWSRVTRATVRIPRLPYVVCQVTRANMRISRASDAASKHFSRLILLRILYNTTRPQLAIYTLNAKNGQHVWINVLLLSREDAL